MWRRSNYGEQASQRRPETLTLGHHDNADQSEGDASA
jgi:hypothetical protein